MSEEISAKDRRIFQNILKDLEAHSLLDENETVTEGFSPVIMQKFYTPLQPKYYSLVTQKKLILIQKKSFSQPDKFELTPFETINAIFYLRVRFVLYLLFGIGGLCFFSWALFFGFNSIPHIIAGPIELIILSLMIIIISLSVFGTILCLVFIREFIRSTHIIFLDISEEPMVILYPSTLGGLKFERKITILNLIGGDLVVQTKKATMEGLYDILSAVDNLKGFKDNRTRYIFYLFSLNKLRKKIIQWHLQNGDTNG